MKIKIISQSQLLINSSYVFAEDLGPDAKDEERRKKEKKEDKNDAQDMHRDIEADRDGVNRETWLVDKK